jgi:hypothetical protein
MRSTGCFFAIFILSVLVLAQSPQQDSIMRFAVLEHVGDGSVRVKAYEARPLRSALRRVANEYHWTIYFEDPQYESRYDLVDSTDPQWRAAHPNEKGALRIAGGAFESRFQEGPNIRTPAGEERVIRSIVSSYNLGGNPGKFLVRPQGNGYAVIGYAIKDDNARDRGVSALLDTPVSVPSQVRGVEETITVILSALSTKTRHNVRLMTFPSNSFRGETLTVGGHNVPARELLFQALDQVCGGCFLNWDLLYDPGAGPSYGFNIDVQE